MRKPLNSVKSKGHDSGKINSLIQSLFIYLSIYFRIFLFIILEGGSAVFSWLISITVKTCETFSE